nr:Crp/Fnr family transcriptional regulator [Parahaliea mediterranea]
MHDFVSGLPAEGREAFERLSTLISVAAGSPVYRQGDESNEVYQLVEGAVRLCNVTEEGREVVTAEFQAGDCIGEMGMVDNLPRVSYAIASRDSVLRVLSRKHFEELTLQFPELKDLLLLTLCRRLRALYALHEEISLSLHQRVARAVLRLAYTHGCNEGEGRLYIKLSQEDLGCMLGATRQSINKELQVLKRAGVLTLEYGRIYVTDLASLEQGYEYLTGMEQITATYGKRQEET